jgi:hypothetical protein
LRSAIGAIQKLEAENARLVTLVGRLRREMMETRGIATVEFHAEPGITIDPELMTAPSVSLDPEEDTSSEPYRPPVLDDLFLKFDRCPELPDMPELNASQPPIDFQREINSLQREIESLKLELVSQ